MDEGTTHDERRREIIERTRSQVDGDNKDRSFTTGSDSVRPSDLFDNIEGETNTNPRTRFVSKLEPKRILYFIFGTRNAIFDRYAIYAYTGGPYNLDFNRLYQEVDGLEGCDSPQTTERAELEAAIGALHNYTSLLDNSTPKCVVLATSSRYLLDEVIHSTYSEEVRNKRSNLGLKKVLLHYVLFCELKGCEVKFWHIKRNENKAMMLAAKWLSAQ